MIGFADEVQWKMQLLKRGNSPNKTSQVSFVLADIMQINSKWHIDTLDVTSLEYRTEFISTKWRLPFLLIMQITLSLGLNYLLRQIYHDIQSALGENAS